MSVSLGLHIIEKWFQSGTWKPMGIYLKIAHIFMSLFIKSFKISLENVF